MPPLALAVMVSLASQGAAAEPIASADPAAIDGKPFDLLVVGGTPGGVACAVRAAREGLSVLLVNRTRHVGGMMANGLVQWDALYGGQRSPLFTELLRNIEGHYRTTCGADSHDYQSARFTQEHYPLGMVEPHVAEREFARLLAAEKSIAMLLGYYPTAVEREGAMLQRITLREFGGTREIGVAAKVFADATYEGDLAALAKVPYRVGREAREEYDEPHAGKVFTNIAPGPAPQDAVKGRLAIRPYGSRQGSIDPQSPHTADRAVQAYNSRFCVTRDPANRILPDKPPGYRREEYLDYERKYIGGHPGPNQKSHMNSPILPGENHDYPEGDWATRARIERRHLDFALGLMYFLQNDPSVPPARREQFRQWGLAKDEFTDNGHVPHEMYVREARRIVGRTVYTEHDNSLAPGIHRTPVHPDSIAITDWYMDSHACTTDSRPGYKYDGKLILTEESRPGQVPYRCLLPQGVDNLLVPVCLSATHVAWGAIRLEPVWMQTGEAAGFAAAQAVKTKAAPADIDTDRLLRTLAERGAMISFFNDVDVASGKAWVPAVEFLATKGFFASYNSYAEKPLTAFVARVWAETFGHLLAGRLDAHARAVFFNQADRSDRRPVPAEEFAAMLARPLEAVGRDPTKAQQALKKLALDPEGVLSRGDACRLMYELSGDVPSRIRLSETGSDRATAYVMSNKIARRRGLLVCTWLDSGRQNRWALADPGKGTILKHGAVGGRLPDNHCGAALATDTDGTLHLLLGAHHGSFAHYRIPPHAESWEPVPDGKEVGEAATYPSLVCDREGTLHLTYRREDGGRNPRLCYARRPRGGPWSEPRVLVASAVPEHSWLTNAIEVGPKGRLHVVVSNTLPVPDRGPDARYYGGSHLYSDDSGETWRQLGRPKPLRLPAPAAELARIEGDGMAPERIEARYGGPRGPRHSYYHKILLSNPVVDEGGRPWVIVHNLLDGSAELFRHTEAGRWAAIPLLDHVRSVLPGFGIRHCGQLSRHGDGTIEAVLMVAPERERGWGTKGTELVRLLVSPAGTVTAAALVRPRDPEMPHWLPSLERWCPHAPIDRPALLFTRGINAGGYEHNRNRVNTGIWLDVP